MTDNEIFRQLGVSPVINAVGHATRVSGSKPSAAVLDAMRLANEYCFEIDDLQMAASKLTAQAIGAESGIITCGAAAALTLGAAACLAGNDPDIMDLLPDTASLTRREIIYPKPGDFHYDHAVRLSGAKVIEVDYDAPDALAQIEAAISECTAAIGYVWLSVDQTTTLVDVIELAHARGLPVIVDAAMSLPPTHHLSEFIAQGADLVTISGGKHIGGPQASGLLMGKRDLIRSAWVQMVDMDVRAQTWSLRQWIDEGWITRPPRHGIGRSMKVGKESILGLMVALKAYQQRDHTAEYEQWHGRLARVAEELDGLSRVQCELLDIAANGQPYPCIQLRSPEGIAWLQKRLRSGEPRVLLAESETDHTLATIYPMCLTEEDATVLVQRIKQAATDE